MTEIYLGKSLKSGPNPNKNLLSCLLELNEFVHHLLTMLRRYLDPCQHQRVLNSCCTAYWPPARPLGHSLWAGRHSHKAKLGTAFRLFRLDIEDWRRVGPVFNAMHNFSHFSGRNRRTDNINVKTNLWFQTLLKWLINHQADILSFRLQVAPNFMQILANMPTGTRTPGSWKGSRAVATISICYA